MAYLSPEQITGQVLLNMHVNDRGQIVTSSNFNIDLEYVDSGTSILLDRGKIYSKYAGYGDSSVTSPLVGKLMNNVTEFTFACWLHYAYSRYLSILNDYIILSVDNSTKKLSAIINNMGDEINLTSFDDGEDPWKHIAIVLHNGKFTFYVNGIRQIDATYQEYNDKNWNEIWYDNGINTDDLCLILNQAVWTDNFTPPEEPLLGDLKYKTELWPENTVIVDHSDHGDLMVKLY